jgi:hypothetical protein
LKIRLLKFAMGQAPGSEMELQPHTAELLIRRGAAVAVEAHLDQAPGVTAVLSEVPKKNKSMTARQKGR